MATATDSLNIANIRQVLGNGNPFFKVGSESGLATDLLGSGQSAQNSTATVPILTPKNGFVDVFNSMYWRARPSKQDLEIPQLLLTEYNLKWSGWLNNIATLAQAKISGGIFDAYKTLYVGDLTGFTYQLPWLFQPGDSLVKLDQNWGEYGTENILPTLDESNSKDSKFSHFIKELGGIAIQTAAATQAGTNGFDKMYRFNSTNRRSLDVSFPLYNTISPQQTFINYCFVILLSFQNMMTRTSLLTFRPPKIYKVESTGYGGIYMPAAYIQNLNISSIGTTRVLKEFSAINSSANSQGIMVPEAYKVSFTIQEVLPASTNIYIGTFGGTKVNVVQPSSATASSVIQSGISKITNAGQTLVNTIGGLFQ